MVGAQPLSGGSTAPLQAPQPLHAGVPDCPSPEKHAVCPLGMLLSYTLLGQLVYHLREAPSQPWCPGDGTASGSWLPSAHKGLADGRCLSGGTVL